MKLAQRSAIAAALAASLAPVLLFAYLGMQSRPLSDDHCFIYTAKHLDLLEYLIYWRDRIDGSFSDYMVRRLLGPLDANVTWLFPSILIGVWLLSTAALLAKCLTLLSVNRYRRVIALALSKQLVAAICSGLYSEMALYWYAASVKYSVPMVSLTFFLLLLLNAARRPLERRWKQLLTVAGGLLCFITAGFSETLSIALFVGLSIVLGALRLQRGVMWRRCKAILVAGWLAIVVSMPLMVSATGVARRLEMERGWNPDHADMAIHDVLARTFHISLDRVTDPDAFAAWALALAAGLIVSLRFAAPTIAARNTSFHVERVPLLLCLVAQLFLLPMVWSYQSYEPSVLGRFSLPYTVFIAGHAALIGGLALLLARRARANELLRGRQQFLTGAALAVILVLVLLAQIQRLPLSLYQFLWVTSNSMLIVLARHLCARLPQTWSRGFVLGMGCFYAVTWAAIAATAFAGLYFAGRDIGRTFTFASHLIVWQGLAWGLALGYALKVGRAVEQVERTIWMLRAAAAVVALALIGGIVADQLAILPNFRLFAREYDARHVSIVSQRDAGKRLISTAPLSFDLNHYLNTSINVSYRCAVQYYELDDTMLVLQ